MPVTKPRTTKDLIAYAREQGLSVEQGGKHYKVRTATGRPIATFATTPSDHRAYANTVAQIKRALGDDMPPVTAQDKRRSDRLVRRIRRQMAEMPQPASKRTRAFIETTQEVLSQNGGPDPWPNYHAARQVIDAAVRRGGVLSRSSAERIEYALSHWPKPVPPEYVEPPEIDVPVISKATGEPVKIDVGKAALEQEVATLHELLAEAERERDAMREQAEALTKQVASLQTVLRERPEPQTSSLPLAGMKLRLSIPLEIEVVPE